MKAKAVVTDGKGAISVETLDGEMVRVALEAPIADVRRVPTKWMTQVMNLGVMSIAHAKSSEAFSDARVERDVVGTVVASTAYSVTLDTPDGLLVLPFETVTAIGPVVLPAAAR